PQLPRAEGTSSYWRERDGLATGPGAMRHHGIETLTLSVCTLPEPRFPFFHRTRDTTPLQAQRQWQNPGTVASRTRRDPRGPCQAWICEGALDIQSGRQRLTGGVLQRRRSARTHQGRVRANSLLL